MKKKYFAPEMEEVKADEPVVLDMTESSGGSMVACPTETCTDDSCPSDSD